MQKHFYQKICALMCLIALLLFSIFLAFLTVYFLDKTTLFENPRLVVQELFARLFLFWLILFVYGPLLLSKTVRTRFITERYVLIMLILFALGAAFAMGDPIHPIRGEDNFIRYWTAGVLGVAGVISVLSGLSRAHRLPDRLVGGFFGLLLVAAAGDELFEFHERGGLYVDVFLPSESHLSGGDMVTLGVAAFGGVAVVMTFLVLRFKPWAKNLISERRYRRTFSLFALAVLSFLTAMMLDSFDWYLKHFANQLRATISEHSGTNEVPRWISVNNMTQAANSLEELLEYLAALFFLMMIGTLFSVKAMGCDLPSNINSDCVTNRPEGGAHKGDPG